MMEDYMVRAIAAGEQIRAFAVTSANIAETARKAHNTSPIATAALGRTMSGALMMADMLKGDQDLLTIRIDGDGPLQGITVTADNHGNVKGFVGNPYVILPPNESGHLNVGGGVGKGTLTVIRDLDLKNTYSGQVELYSGEIAEDLTHYFAESEQIPSAVGLGVLMNRTNTVRCAGGYIIQLMPFASDEVIGALEENIRDAGYVTDMLDAGLTPEDMLRTVLKGFDVDITDRKPVRFHCNCERERVERALLLVGEKELTDMIEKGEPVELSCRFCGKKYRFLVPELESIRRELRSQKDGEA